MPREQQPVVRPPIKAPPVILPPAGHRRVVPPPLPQVVRPPIKAPPVILPPVGHRRVAPPPLQPAVPPLIIAPVQARVGPTRYLYVPGLAHDALVVTPCADKQAFIARIENTFGFRKKWIVFGEVMANYFRHDEFMTGAVNALCDTKGAIPVNCGRALRWVPVRGTQAPSKAFQLLGMPQQNLLAVNPGNKPKAPKGLQFGNQHWELCLAAEYLAHTKGKVVPPNDQDRAQPNGARALTHLQADDILCILGHGNALGATLTYKFAPPASHRVKDDAIKAYQPGLCATHDHLEKWHVDANTLAALLADEGLPITHQVIEMAMCFGAGLSLSNEQTVQPFCQRLAGALSGLGYKQIKVRGALGLMIGSDLSVNASLTPQGNKLVIDPERNVRPTDPDHEKLFVTFTSNSKADGVASKLPISS